MFKIWCDGCHHNIDAGEMWHHRKTCEPYLELQARKEESDARRTEIQERKNAERRAG